MVIGHFRLSRKRIVTQPGKKNKERGLLEPRLEERWDRNHRMEKGERRKKKEVFSGTD